MKTATVSPASPAMAMGKDSPGTASAGKKRKAATKDIDTVPPSGYDEDIFKLTCPFVKPQAFSESTQENAFGGGFCDGKTITHLLRNILQPIVDPIADTFSKCGKELQWRCVVGSIFSVFKRLSIDVSADYLQIFENENVKRDGVEPVVEVAADTVEATAVHPLNRNLALSFGGLGSAGSFRDGLNVHEGRANLSVGCVDFACYIKDKIVVQRSGNEKKYCTAALVDSKSHMIDPRDWDGVRGCLWQLAKYGVEHAMANFRLGTKKKVYLLILSSGTFCVAAIQPQGILVVNAKGEIEDCEFFTASTDLEKKGMLDTLSLCNEKRKSMASTNLPAGEHLVGDLLFSSCIQTWQVFPTTLGTGIPPFTYILIEGLLRVLIGDRVKLWGASHLDALVKRYESRRQRIRDETWEIFNIPTLEKVHNDRLAV